METITENDLKKRIIDMEKQYKEITSKVQASQKTLSNNERELLTCMQGLMPLQNAFFRSVIEDLQKQLADRPPAPTLASQPTIDESAVLEPVQTSTGSQTPSDRETRLDNVNQIDVDNLPV